MTELNKAVSESERKKSFECEKCGKVCKSKGDLSNKTHKFETWRTKGTCDYHLDKITIVEAIKARIIRKDIYNNLIRRQTPLS